MKKNNGSIVIAVAVITICSASCDSPETSEDKNGGTIQDTSMPGQQNDGFPYNNPNSRRDNLVRDSSAEIDSIKKH